MSEWFVEIAVKIIVSSCAETASDELSTALKQRINEMLSRYYNLLSILALDFPGLQNDQLGLRIVLLQHLTRRCKTFVAKTSELFTLEEIFFGSLLSAAAYQNEYELTDRRLITLLSPITTDEHINKILFPRTHALTMEECLAATNKQRKSWLEKANQQIKNQRAGSYNPQNMGQIAYKRASIMYELMEIIDLSITNLEIELLKVMNLDHEDSQNRKNYLTSKLKSKEDEKANLKTDYIKTMRYLKLKPGSEQRAHLEGTECKERNNEILIELDRVIRFITYKSHSKLDTKQIQDFEKIKRIKLEQLEALNYELAVNHTEAMQYSGYILVDALRAFEANDLHATRYAAFFIVELSENLEVQDRENYRLVIELAIVIAALTEIIIFISTHKNPSNLLAALIKIAPLYLGIPERCLESSDAHIKTLGLHLQQRIMPNFKTYFSLADKLNVVEQIITTPVHNDFNLEKLVQFEEKILEINRFITSQISEMQISEDTSKELENIITQRYSTDLENYKQRLHIRPPLLRS